MMFVIDPDTQTRRCFPHQTCRCICLCAAAAFLSVTFPVGNNTLTSAGGFRQDHLSSLLRLAAVIVFAAAAAGAVVAPAGKCCQDRSVPTGAVERRERCPQLPL